jgi:hypothetical protein
VSTTDEDTDVDIEVAASAPRKESNLSFRLVSVAAAVFALLAIAMVVVVVRDRPNNETNGDRADISSTAARVAEAITAVDPAGSGALAATVEQFGTAPVIAQYKEISGAIGKVMGPLKLTSIRGSVKEVYVGNIEGSEVKVIVRLDLVYVGDNTRVIPDQYLDMSVAKLDGTWKVDNVQVLNVELNGGATTTTAPASTSSSSG